MQTDAQPADVPAATWDALLAQQAEPTPFMRHAYLAALHASGSAVAKTGWAPRFALLWDGVLGRTDGVVLLLALVGMISWVVREGIVEGGAGSDDALGAEMADEIPTDMSTGIALFWVVFGLAILLAQSRWVERAFLPFAIILQVTPVIAIAPLLLVWLEPSTAVLVCAFIVAFFPILSNTAVGLASTDHNLIDLFELYRASRWKQLIWLRLPAALPYFFSGLRIAGGLALIGAIVAELAAGAAGQGTGLAFRITEAGFRLNIPRMFAALTLISLTGIAIYALFTLLSNLFLGRWHDSARARER